MVYTITLTTCSFVLFTDEYAVDKKTHTTNYVSRLTRRRTNLKSEGVETSGPVCARTCVL